MIEITGLRKISEKKILKNVSLTVEKGMIYGIVGTNGVGKTTLLKIISGLLEPSEGQVKIDPNHSIGFVPDSTALYEYLTGEEYLYFAASVLGLTKKESDEKITKVLKDFNLSHSKDQLLTTYSNGMKQKISIAAVIISNPDILLLDEPLTGVDMISSNIIKDYMKNFILDHKSIILTTHQLELAHNICDKIGIIHEGELVAEFEVQSYSIKQLEQIIKDVYLNG